MLVVRFPSGLCLRSFFLRSFSSLSSGLILLTFCNSPISFFFQFIVYCYFFSLLLFVFAGSLVAAFVFVLCLSPALVAVVFWCCNSRLNFWSMVFTIIHSQLGYVSGEGDKKKGEDEERWQERSRAWITWINGRRIVEKESKEVTWSNMEHG